MRSLLVLGVLLPSAAALGVSSLHVNRNLLFAALGDWGGQSAFPFVTAGQTAGAASLAAVAAAQHLDFVVSAGGNFLSAGLPGAHTEQTSFERLRSCLANSERGLTHRAQLGNSRQSRSPVSLLLSQMCTQLPPWMFPSTSPAASQTGWETSQARRAGSP